MYHTFSKNRKIREKCLDCYIKPCYESTIKEDVWQTSRHYIHESAPVHNSKTVQSASVHQVESHQSNLTKTIVWVNEGSLALWAVFEFGPEAEILDPCITHIKTRWIGANFLHSKNKCIALHTFLHNSEYKYTPITLYYNTCTFTHLQ